MSDYTAKSILRLVLTMNNKQFLSFDLWENRIQKGTIKTYQRLWTGSQRTLARANFEPTTFQLHPLAKSLRHWPVADLTHLCVITTNLINYKINKQWSLDRTTFTIVYLTKLSPPWKLASPANCESQDSQPKSHNGRWMSSWAFKLVKGIKHFIIRVLICS